MPPVGGIITASFRIANHQVVGQSPGVVRAPQHIWVCYYNFPAKITMLWGYPIFRQTI